MLNWEENAVFCLFVFFACFSVLICSSLPNPPFGRVDLTGRTIGSTATYSCQRGYTLVGVTTRTCQANRQWSGKAPVCKSEWAKKDLWLLYQSTAASGVCSFYQIVTLYYYTVNFCCCCCCFCFCFCCCWWWWYKKYSYHTVLSCRETNINSHFILITSCGLWPTWQPRRWQSDSERDHLWLYRFLQLSQRVRFSWPNQSCVPGQWTVVSICSYLQRCDGSAYII